MNASLDTGKLVCRGCWDLMLGLLDWLIGLLVGTLPRVATRLLSRLVLGCLCPCCGLCGSIGMVPW